MTREQIIAEIKRTAALNGGTEAGFSPLRLEAGYSDDELLEALVPLARELGHVPTSRELKMKSHAEPDFPSEKVFRRFGGKAQLARRLGEFSSSRAYSDVVAICEALAQETDSKIQRDQIPTAAEPSDGYVYMVKLGKHYKIGKTFAVPRRHREIALELPEKPDVVHSIRTDDPTGVEARRLALERGDRQVLREIVGGVARAARLARRDRARLGPPGGSSLSVHRRHLQSIDDRPAETFPF